MSQGLFGGLKVIDCASFIAAPAAATVLSDFGADVIKIEPPGEGDGYRTLHARPGAPQSPNKDDYGWMLGSRNKRGIALDLKSPDGLAVLQRLVDTADVFVTNMPLPARRRLKISYEDLSARNPRLIYASFTAYGEAGEEADPPPARVLALEDDVPDRVADAHQVVLVEHERVHFGFEGEVVPRPGVLRRCRCHRLPLRGKPVSPPSESPPVTPSRAPPPVPGSGSGCSPGTSSAASC